MPVITVASAVAHAPKDQQGCRVPHHQLRTSQFVETRLSTETVGIAVVVARLGLPRRLGAPLVSSEQRPRDIRRGMSVRCRNAATWRTCIVRAPPRGSATSALTSKALSPMEPNSHKNRANRALPNICSVAPVMNSLRTDPKQSSRNRGRGCTHSWLRSFVTSQNEATARAQYDQACLVLCAAPT